MKNTQTILTALLVSVASLVYAADASKSLISWQPHNAAAFQQAAKEKKLLLLDLEAVWCHWCHVMDAKTYANKEVAAYITKHFIALKADHDARPDLAERYRDWGWPATIILASDGTEIVKRAGYISPENMLKLLAAVTKDSSAEGQQVDALKQFSTSFVLDPEVRRELIERNITSHDSQGGGLNIAQRYVEGDTIEWDLLLASLGDAAAKERALRTLDAGLALIDPEFGGVYQYSTHSDWQHPHYEKIMRSQWTNIKAYSLAYKQFRNPRYLQAAELIAQYLFDFWASPEGGFHASQDADLIQGVKGHEYFALKRAQRLKRGLPRIDKNLYAGENGLAIEALLMLYDASGKEVYFDKALVAMHWALKNRRYADGGFRHNQIDDAGPYLSDTLYMGRAFLRLYEKSGDKQALELALKAGNFINRYFRYPKAGVVSAADNGTPVKPIPQIDQNIAAVRFLLALTKHSGEKTHGDLAKHILRYLNTPEIALQRLTEAGILLADFERRLVFVEKALK